MPKETGALIQQQIQHVTPLSCSLSHTTTLQQLRRQLLARRVRTGGRKAEACPTRVQAPASSATLQQKRQRIHCFSLALEAKLA